MSQTATLLPSDATHQSFEFMPPNYVLAIYLPGNIDSRLSVLKAPPFFHGTLIALLENVRAEVEGRTYAT
jgi:hypothetical protein